MIVPLAILGAVTAAATWKGLRRKPKVMTEQQRAIYEAALATLKEPVKFRELAAAYEKEGFRNEARILRMRAAVRELPADIKAARKAVFKTAISSKDPNEVREVAAAFEGEGCYGAARDLYAYADGLITEVVNTPVPELPLDDEASPGTEEESSDEASEDEQTTAESGE